MPREYNRVSNRGSWNENECVECLERYEETKSNAIGLSVSCVLNGCMKHVQFIVTCVLSVVGRKRGD